jgi:Glycosyl transferase family 2
MTRPAEAKSKWAVEMSELTAITVSINCADYLAKCIARNANIVTRWIVVTDRQDLQTVELCRAFSNIEIVFTKTDFEPGIAFPKSKMINEGFHHLPQSGWVLHLDSDVLLPRNTMEFLRTDRLDRKCMYGTRSRLLVDDRGVVSGSHGAHFTRNIGYFQLFHTSRLNPYPELSTDAAFDDLAFNAHWPSECLRKLEGPKPIHFGPKQAHWKGRTRGNNRLNESKRCG